MELWAWGANNYGQLGVGTTCEQVDKPTKIPLPSGCNIDVDAVQIAGGGGHTLLTDSSKKRLYAVGWNNKGQLGLGNGLKNVETFVEVNLGIICKENREKRIKKIACGWDFSLVLISDGTIFGCGSNTFGQLGLDEKVKVFSSFAQITSLPENDIVDISCGMRHALLLDGKGNVYSIGCGKKGQLGLGECVKRLFTPTKISGIPPSAQSVHCGQHFSAVMITSQTGCEMFTFGDNKYNQVSNSSVSTIYKPELQSRSRLKEDVNNIIEVSCGWTHAVMLLRSNGKKKVVSWGRNNYGQLGSKSINHDHGYAVVELPEDTIKIASGYEHCLVVTEKGNLYAWGWNEHSNCGVDEQKENVSTPQLVPLNNKTAVDCFAGSAHSFVLLQTQY